jgi:hypothetical protein
VKPARAKPIALRSETCSVVSSNDISAYQCTGRGSSRLCMRRRVEPGFWDRPAWPRDESAGRKQDNTVERMKISEAIALIRTSAIEWTRPQSWCDLGCGSGTFTVALAQSLVSGSTIDAVDLDQGALKGIPDEYHGVTIRKILGDLRSPTPSPTIGGWNSHG